MRPRLAPVPPRAGASLRAGTWRRSAANRVRDTLFAAAFVVTLLGPGAMHAAPAPFIVNFLPLEVSYDPLSAHTSAEAQILSGIYEGLVGYDPFSLDPMPATASRWDISADGRRYRFFIRKEARFSNGDRVVAGDFRDTWLMLLDPEADAAYASLLDVVRGARAYRIGEVLEPTDVGIRVVSDRILEVELEHRATHFLRILAHHSFVPIHHSVRTSGDWSDPRAIPVNGPYTVAAADEAAIELTANPVYWDRARVAYEAIRIEFDADTRAVTDRFNEGRIDWVRGAADPRRVARREHLVVNLLYATTYYQLSAVHEPFKDPRVRRAMALLLPWERLRSADRWYRPATSLVPQVPSYPPAAGINATDHDEALRLLADAGFPSGVGMPPIVISIPTSLDREFVARSMVDSWESALDVDVTVEVIPYPEYYSIADRRGYMVSAMSWVGDFADPLTFLDMWVTGSNLNTSGFSHPVYDALIAKAVGMTGSERYATLSAAEQILLSDGIVLPISHSPAINLVNLELIDGWYPNPLDIHPFKHIRPVLDHPVPNVADTGGPDDEKQL